MSQLDKLAQHRDAILLAELAGLLHNIGKLNPNFVKSTVNDEGNAVDLLKRYNQFVDGYAFKRFAKPSTDALDSSVKTLLANSTKLDTSQLPGHPPGTDLEKKQQTAADNFNKFYRGTGPLSDSQSQALSKILEVSSEAWRLTDLLTLFWDDFFHKPANDDYQRTYALDRWLISQPNGLPHLLIHAHGEMSGSEKYQITEEELTGTIVTNDVLQEKSSFNNLRIATAFGYETEVIIWKLQAKQQRIITQATNLSFDDEQWRLKIQAVLRHGLGDTQRPINEITLWDYASSIAALFKTSIAKSFLEGAVADANQMHWRLLGVRFDGLDYISQASRIADILGRQQKYQQVLNQICIALTQETPIASQIYQDESGLFFVVPDSDKLKLEDLQALVENQLQKSQFDNLRPQIGWSEKPLRGKQLNLGQELKRQDKIERCSIDSVKVEKWWRNSSTQICEVCGLRPAVSRETKHCSACRNSRQSRVQTWLSASATTIWLDEVADSNGRLTLITGQFPLNQWLDGTLVESLALGMDINTGNPVSKFASFPRVQRVWQTTQTFWQETQAHINQMLADARRRLTIKLANQPSLTKHHVYELNLLGHTRMSVLWDGAGLISTDNLSYTAVQLNIKLEEHKTPADAALAVGAWLEGNKQRIFQLVSDDEKNQRFDIQIADVSYQDTSYSTTIPILAEPRTFMALVPADKALDVIAAIKTKYAREMGKVRNRLPLHLGAVYFHRRMPLAAAMDAGRRMLKRQSQSVCAEVIKLKPAHLPADLWPANASLTLKLDKHEITLAIPIVMGDGTTQDVWYPYWQVQGKPTDRTRYFAGADGEHWVHVCDLRAGDRVNFTPATFDFEFLDTTARRFEVAYDETSGQRLGRPIRPYLLDDLTVLQDIWKTIAGPHGLASSQIYALRDLVEAKRATWAIDDSFSQFCRHAVRNAQWKNRQAINLEQIVQATVSGLLTDVIELYMGIMKAKPQRQGEEV